MPAGLAYLAAALVLVARWFEPSPSRAAPEGAFHRKIAPGRTTTTPWTRHN
jgi:hypothetical protein